MQNRYPDKIGMEDRVQTKYDGFWYTQGAITQIEVGVDFCEPEHNDGFSLRLGRYNGVSGEYVIDQEICGRTRCSG